MEILTVLALVGSACGIPGAIDVFLKWRKQSTKNFSSQLQEGNRENQPQTTLAEPINDAKVQVSNRLYKILALVNQNRNIKATISEIAEFCEYEKTSDLEKYFLGLEEPRTEEKEKICIYLGVNPQWLKHGKGEPFKSQEPNELYDINYLDLIKKKSPKKIIFIRSKAEDGATCIVLQLDDFKYIYLPKTWHISGEVGSTGRDQVYSFYKLIKAIQNYKETNYEFQCVSIVGNHAKKQDFDDLTNGRVYPGSMIERYNDNWWDDLTDIDHSWHYAPSYEKKYGKGFIEAQEIIRYKISVETN